MITGILDIRIKQAYRMFSDIGIFRTVFLVGFVALFFISLFFSIKDNTKEELVMGIFLLSILFLHLKRKDKEFIEIYAPKPHPVFLTEYAILSIPLILSLFSKYLWGFVIVYLFILTLIPLLKITPKKSSLNTVFQKWIPDENFEWKAGTRKYLLLFMVLWPVGFLTSFFTASVPVILFILSAVVLSFYQKSEPLSILLAGELSTVPFLKKKVKSQLLSFSVLVLPLVLSFIIFHPRFYYIPVLEYVLFVILIIYTLLLKYAFYQPDKESGAIKVYSWIGAFCLFIPVFIPVILILSVKFLFQASNRLNFYLHDFN